MRPILLIGAAINQVKDSQREYGTTHIMRVVIDSLPFTILLFSLKTLLALTACVTQQSHGVETQNMEM